MTSVQVDGHVHLHPEYDRRRFFARAFDAVGGAEAPLLLFLLDSHDQRAFGDLRAGRGGPLPLGCTALSTDEPESLVIRGPAGKEVFLIGGRQIASSERLEVLVVGLPAEHELSTVAPGEARAAELVERGLAAGALTGLPWGFGKWLGTRGRIVSDLMRRDELRANPRFFLGDISARCRPWPVPAAFRAGPPVLPGTDPLPLPGCEGRLARYGFRMRVEFEPRRPWRSLKRALEHGNEVCPMGAPEGTLRTLWDQLRYRLRGRRVS